MGEWRPGERGVGSSLAFGEKLLALLDTGSFTTSYKYALLLAILDATLEGTAPDGSAPDVLHARDLGRRVFELYWQQARPFSETGPLQQSRQRDLVVKIAELRADLGLAEHVTLARARDRHPVDLRRIEREAVAVVVRYPVVLLQRFGSGAGALDDRFIYDVPWSESISATVVHHPDFDDRLRLQPDAGEHLAALAGLARPVIEREWLRHVARRNLDHVDELRLEAFLFGRPRVSLAAVRDPLLQLQRGSCFYCEGNRGPWEVDHFLPWARWPDDRLDNLVVAHRRCNNSKRASLAALSHLDRWWHRAAPGTAADRQLVDIARRSSWPRDRRRTSAGARGLYLHQPAGTMLWTGPGAVEPLDPRQLSSILEPPAAAAAEATASFERD